MNINHGCDINKTEAVDATLRCQSAMSLVVTDLIQGISITAYRTLHPGNNASSADYGWLDHFVPIYGTMTIKALP